VRFNQALAKLIDIKKAAEQRDKARKIQNYNAAN